METPIYALPADERAATVVPTLVVGTAAAAFPLTNINDGVITSVFKPTTTGAFEIQWDYTAPVVIGSVALVNSQIEAGSAVQLYVTSTAYPGAPSGAETYAVVIAAEREDGMRDNPHVSTIALTAKRYVRLRVPAQAVDVASIGEVKISAGPRRQLTRSFGLEGLDEIETRPGVTVRSPVGVKAGFDFGVTLKSYDVKRWQMNDAEKAEFLTLKRSALIGFLTWLFIYDPDVNDAWLVQFATEPIIRRVPDSAPGDDLWETSFLLDVVSCGIP